VYENGTETDLGELELALVSAAIRLSESYDVDTSLASPGTLQSIQDAVAVIARLGSPPLRVSVARDLVAADFDIDQLWPLLESTLGTGIEVTRASLEDWRDELRDAGPTVSWPGFPPERR